MRDFLEKQISIFFVMATAISVVMGVLGCILAPEAVLDYRIMFGPVFFAAMCTLPSMVLYTSKKKSMAEIVIRRVLHFLLIEAMVNIAVLGIQAEEVKIRLALAAAVAAVYGAVMAFTIVRSRREANALNDLLRKIQ